MPSVDCVAANTNDNRLPLLYSFLALRNPLGPRSLRLRSPVMVIFTRRNARPLSTAGPGRGPQSTLGPAVLPSTIGHRPGNASLW